MSRRFMNVDSWRPGVTNNITITTSASAASAAFGSQTYTIRVCCPVAINVKIGDPAATPTAAATDAYVPANWETFILVTPGQKIAAYGVTAGTVSIVELTQ